MYDSVLEAYVLLDELYQQRIRVGSSEFVLLRFETCVDSASFSSGEDGLVVDVFSEGEDEEEKRDELPVLSPFFSLFYFFFVLSIEYLHPHHIAVDVSHTFLLF